MVYRPHGAVSRATEKLGQQYESRVGLAAPRQRTIGE